MGSLPDRRESITQTMTDEELLQALQVHEDDALAELYDRYGVFAFGLAQQIVGDTAIAEEVIQETFVAVWRQAPTTSLKQIGTLRLWVLSIAHNFAVNYRRGRFFTESPGLLPHPVDVLPDSDIDAAISRTSDVMTADNVQAALATLQREQRDVIGAAYFGGSTYRQIAERRGMLVDVVKQQINLGLNKLYEELITPSTPDDPIPTERDTDGT